MLTENTIARKLNKLSSAVSSRYPEINSGGCCVFAALVAAKLTKIVPINVRVESGSRAYSLDIDHIRVQKANNDCDWSSYGVRFKHVLVSYEMNNRTWYYDARGVKKKYIPLSSTEKDGEKVLCKGALNITEASYLAAESIRWNSLFDRADIPELIELVDMFFEREFKIH